MGQKSKETGCHALPVLVHANQTVKSKKYEAVTLHGSRHCQFHCELQNLSGKRSCTCFIYPIFQKNEVLIGVPKGCCFQLASQLLGTDLEPGGGANDSMFTPGAKFANHKSDSVYSSPLL